MYKSYHQQQRCQHVFRYEASSPSLPLRKRFSAVLVIFKVIFFFPTSISEDKCALEILL